MNEQQIRRTGDVAADILLWLGWTLVGLAAYAAFMGNWGWVLVFLLIATPAFAVHLAWKHHNDPVRRALKDLDRDL